MKWYEKTNRVMEIENHLKNRISPKSQTSRKNLLPGAILMCLLWVIPLMANAQTWQIGSNVTATLSSGTLTISGTGDMASYSSNNQPWYSKRANINALVIQSGVTSISAQAFNNCTNLQTVTIEDGTVPLQFANMFGHHFDNSPIETLYLGRDIETEFIGVESSNGCPFAGNTALKTVTVGNNVTAINDNSFQNCTGLQSLTVGIAIITIGNNAFDNCSNFAGALTIPNKVRTIGNSAFQGCRTLSSVIIPNSVTTIGYRAFNNCTNLQTVTIEAGTVPLQFANMFGHHFDNSPIETLYLGRDIETEFIGVESSNGSPFAENTALKTVTVGNNVTAINDYSFQNCTGLQSLTVGIAIITIGNNAFYNCSRLAGALTIPNKVKTVGSGAFQGCRVLSSVIIPSSITKIGSQAFTNCTNLQTVTIEDGTVALRFVNMFGHHFDNSPIETLYLGRDIETEFIGVESSNGCPFSGNTALKTVTIGNNVTAINDNSFQNCTGLDSITIPSNITSIGSSAFAGCRLMKIYSQRPTPPNAVDGCFYNASYDVYANCKLYVPTVDKYSVAPEWKKFSTILTGINDVILNQLSISPNPAKEDIFIKSDSQIKKVEIFSLSGSLMMSESNFTGKISVATLSQGIYLLKVYTDKSMAVSKFVKE